MRGRMDDVKQRPPDIVMFFLAVVVLGTLLVLVLHLLGIEVKPTY
jgi:hypothetical protein